MDKERLMLQFEKMGPDHEQKERMLKRILVKSHPSSRVAEWKRHRSWITISAACLVLVIGLWTLFLFAGKVEAFDIHVKMDDQKGTIRLASDREEGAVHSVTKVDARPSLEFYVVGDDIAQIEIEAKNEYLSAQDWTRTQHEKYWNVEYYQYLDEEKQIAIFDSDKYYDKKIVMTFDEHFQDYDKIWYRWHARNMYEWAAEDNFSRFLGFGIPVEDVNVKEKLDAFDTLSGAEKLKMASGVYEGIGHIQLDDYPEHLTEDRITITVTDRKGRKTTQVIGVKVSNNEKRQTVVTARLLD